MARHSSINHAKERRRRFDAERRRRDGAERMRTITFPGGNAPFGGSERVPIARAARRRRFQTTICSTMLRM
jgi:hypothetical protein